MTAAAKKTAKPAKKTNPKKASTPKPSPAEAVDVAASSRTDELLADAHLNGLDAGAMAEALLDIPDGAQAVPLAGEIVHILPTANWFTSTFTFLKSGDFDSWAEDALAPGEFEQVWCRLHGGRGPLLAEVDDMFSTFFKLTGIDLGKLPRSMASSVRMATR